MRFLPKGVRWMPQDRAALIEHFETTLRRYGDDVYRAAFIMTQNRADAEDIVQETFLRYAMREEGFRSEAHEKAWLLCVAVNLGKDLLRSAWRKKSRSLQESDLSEEPVLPCDNSVYNAVARLPLKYRTAVHLFYYEGYSVREISRMTGQSEAAVKKQLSRGREMLRTALKGAGDYEF